MNHPEISPEPGTTEVLQQEVNVLRQVVNAAILLVLVIVTCLNFFFYKQVSGLRAQVENSERQLKVASEEFERSYKPMAGVFLQNLVAFAQRYPDFAPILAKYQPAPQAPSPAK